MDNHSVICGAYPADTGRMVCPECEKPNKAKLKPCLFCGSNAISIRDYDPFDGYQGNLTVYRVWCRNCGAQVEQKDVMDAIRVWNRRAEDGK